VVELLLSMPWVQASLQPKIKNKASFKHVHVSLKVIKQFSGLSLHFRV
jgi:hypothetical protein